MRHVVALLPLLLGGFGVAVAQQSSPSFLMQNVTLTTGSQRSASSSFETVVRVDQPSISGAASSCNTGFATGLGLLSALEVAVPIRLRLEKTPTDAQLTWTGSDPQFEVYRAETPDQVVQAGNLLEVTSQCGTTDSLSGSAVTFYRVVGP